MAKGSTVGNLAGYIAQYVAEGFTATGALTAFRETGAGARTQTWYRTWQTVADTVDRSAAILALPGDRLPPDDVIVEWEAGRAGTYLTQGFVVVEDQDTGQMLTRAWSLPSSGPLSKDEAGEFMAADAEFGTLPGGSAPNERVRGVVITGVFRMTGRAA